MDISINATYLYRKRVNENPRSTDDCIRLCTEAGFKVLDYTPNIWSDAWELDVETVMNAAAKYGATIGQSHAPYNFYSKLPLEKYTELLYRSVEASRRMGVRDLVFHADEYHPPKGMPYDGEAALAQVYEILAPVVEKTVSYGINAALETVFEDATLKPKEGQRMHFCGDVNELIAIIDKFNDPKVTCCWDFGHARLGIGNDEQADAIRRMGSRISCTHIHDNYYGKDLHLPPFMGEIKWEEVMPALKETGYSGALTFEMVYGNLRDAQIKPFLSELYLSGLALEEMFNS